MEKTPELDPLKQFEKLLSSHLRQFFTRESGQLVAKGKLKNGLNAELRINPTPAGTQIWVEKPHPDEDPKRAVVPVNLVVEDIVPIWNDKKLNEQIMQCLEQHEIVLEEPQND